MKSLINIIQEKLIINKNLKKPIYYEFNLTNQKVKIKLPFTIDLPEIDKSIEIFKIDEEKDSYNELKWDFYNKYDRPALRLSEIGVINLFIKYIKNNEHKISPKVKYLDNKEYYGKCTQTILADPDNTIIKESNINENLVLNKNLKVNNIFKFDNNRSIKLPFNLEIGSSLQITVTITKIKKVPGEHRDRYEFYDDKDKLLMICPDYHVKTLLFGRHVQLCNILNEEIKKEINGYNSIVVRYKDPNKIIFTESMDITKNEPTIYSNIILLNPDEDKILILKRANYMKMWRGMWGFPGGHVDKKDKNPKEAAIRELKEETGIELSWNESYKLKEYDKIKHNSDNSISYYYITTLESNVDIKLSKEHSNYEWFNEKSEKKNHKWVPDVFQIIQKIL